MKDTIVIIGDTMISNFLLIYSLGLGLDTAKYRLMIPHSKDRSEISRNKHLISKIDNLEIINHNPHKIFLKDARLIIDTSNRYNHFCQEESEKQGLDYMILTSNIHSAGLSINNSLGLDYKNLEQHAPTSALIASIALNTIRKGLKKGSFYYDMLNPKRFIKPRSLRNMKLNKSPVLLIGLGGIGSHVAIDLAYENIKTTAYDDDNIEESNLERQIFYLDNIGKSKSNTLKKYLKRIGIGSRLKAIPKRFDENEILNITKKYSVIISAVDDWKSRQLLNETALLLETPLINVSVTSNSGIFEAYIPERSSCLECKHRLNEHLGSNQSCSTLENNVILTNTTIAAFASCETIAMMNGFDQDYYDTVYHLDQDLNNCFTMFSSNTQCNCEIGDCKCHRRGDF